MPDEFSTGPTDQIRGWYVDGEAALAIAIRQTSDVDLDAPSLLPEWSRRTVIAHLAGNADGLSNLLSWARTGVESPMYASEHARADQIKRDAGLAPDLLRRAAADSAQRLAAAVNTLPVAAWEVLVRTAQGRTIPARDVPWLRVRETWVHAADIVGISAVTLPPALLIRLIDDVLTAWSRRGQTPDLTLVASDANLRRGTGSAATVTGPLTHLFWWLSGRSRDTSRLEIVGTTPNLPKWL